MRVIPTTGPAVELGDVEVNPTIGMTDYSRPVTDDYGVTTVVKRGFSRTLSARIALPFDQVSNLQTSLAALRAQIARWEVDPAYSWLNFDGFFRDFDIDLAVPPLSYCTLTVEGLAETETITDDGSDPAPDGVSSLVAIDPVPITAAEFVTSNVAETDHAAWSNTVTYALGARVIKTSTHRIYESAAAGNLGNDPEGTSGLWIDVGATNRWRMFDQALGSVTTRVNLVTVTIAPGAVDSLAVLDVVANTVRVQVGTYDKTKVVVSGCATFLDLPGTGGNIIVTISRGGGLIASVGTLVTGFLRKIGDTGASPSAGITDYSRKEVDDFGEPTIVERAWARRMNVSALINSTEIDKVANRIAALRGKAVVWIANEGTAALTIYGFFRDFSIEVGQNVSTLALAVDGLAKAPQSIDLSLASILYKSEKPDMVQRYTAILAEQSGIGVTADGFDITTEKATYNAAVTALSSYLAGLSPPYDAYASDTVIDRTAHNQKFNDVDVARQALLNKIAVTSGERAAWPNVRDSHPDAPDNSADVTAFQQVTISPPSPQVVLRDFAGTAKQGELPRTIVPILKRGGLDIRKSADTTYSITANGVTATINNTAGSDDKGKIVVTQAGNGSIQLFVAVSNVSYGPFAIPFSTQDDPPPMSGGSGGGGGGGGGGGASDGTLATISTTSFEQMTSTHSGESVFVIAVAAGQSLHGAAPLSYQHYGSLIGIMSAKWRYRLVGASSWTDFAASAITGSSSFVLEEPETGATEDIVGEIQVTQSSAALSAGNYEVMLVGATNVAGRALVHKTGVASVMVS